MARVFTPNLWTNGFLDSIHQGVQFSSSEERVLYLNDPEGRGREGTRKMLDNLSELNSMSFDEFGDPEIQARVQQYEMAYRMQTAVPELADLTQEPDHIIKMYGSDCLVPGTYASNCLLGTKALGIRCSFRSALSPGMGSARKYGGRNATTG